MNKNNNSLARQRIDYLFYLIKTNEDVLLRLNASKMIDKIRKRYNVRLTLKEKELFCKHCHNPFKTPLIRFKKIKKEGQYKLLKIIICEFCGKENRFSTQI
jgi:RNase P subunit RPR2